MTRLLIYRGVLSIFILIFLIERLNFARGQSDSYNFVDVKTHDVPENNISATCLRDIRLMKASLQNLTLWAMEMWEATARESPHLLEGSNYNLGNFDECLHPVKKGFQNSPDRQYCLITIEIKFDDPQKISNRQSIFDPFGSSLNIIRGNGDPSMIERNVLYWAVCTFASCSTSDVVTMINNHFKTTSYKTKALNISLLASSEDKWCHQETTKNSYTFGAITFICFSCLLITMVIIATMYHYYSEENKKEKCPDMIKAFSLIFHINHLNYKGSGETGLEALNGVRAIAILLVISAHRVVLYTQNPMINREFQEEQYRGIGGIIMRQTDISVDMFFILSGMLGTYNILKRTEKKRVNFGWIILYRYLRIIPLYAYAMFFIASFLPITGDGPFWKHIIEGEAMFCRENWWKNMLMISNYVDVEEMCMAVSWYVPCDFHFFLITLIACFALKKKSWTKIVLILLGVLIVISIIATCLTTYFMHLDATLDFGYKFIMSPRMDPTYQTTYIQSHHRISPYIMGMIGGYILYKLFKPEEKKFSIKKSTIVGISSISIFLIFIISSWRVYRVDEEINPVISAIFSGIHRPIKSFCIFTLIMFCLFGRIPFISSVLEWRPWTVVSKLTFGAYLFHMSLELRESAMARHAFYFDEFVCFKLVLSDIFLAFLMSFLFYVTIEGPSNQLIRALMMPFTMREENSSTSKKTNSSLELAKLHDTSNNKS